MSPMALIGKFYNTFSNIMTAVLILFQYTKNNIVFRGIHSDSDEEQVPQDGIFLRIRFII